MRIRSFSRLLVAVLAAALLLSATPASAIEYVNPRPGIGINPVAPSVDRGPVPDGVTVRGIALGGMTEDRARAVILAYVKASALPPVTVLADGKTYTLKAADYFYTDVECMLDDAYGATGPLELSTRYGLRTAGVQPLLDSIAKTDRAATNAKWIVQYSRLKLVASVALRRTDKATGRIRILAALKREALTGAAQSAVTVPVSRTAAAINEKNIGRAILVVLSERRLRLYDPAKGGYVLKEYRCAVGQPEFPTPTGVFEITEKRYLPTWVNPYSSWSMSMPAYIGPGPGNPLGTRALNLSADGIRIHGTENVDSIGTAASHGCIRLVRHDIEELYPLVVVGTPVYIIAR